MSAGGTGEVRRARDVNKPSSATPSARHDSSEKPKFSRRRPRVPSTPDAINPGLRGTKASAKYRLILAAKRSRTVLLRMTDQPPDQLRAPSGMCSGPRLRQAEAEAFYATVTRVALTG